MNRKEKYNCSRMLVERYLLNQMQAEEEAVFQEHLEACGVCRSYLQEVRSLSRLVMEEKEEPTVRRRLYVWLSVAAGILLLAGVSVFWGNYAARDAGGKPHDVHINHQRRASVDYAPVELLFPARPVCEINLGKEPLVFKWNREAAYRLRLASEGKLVFEADSVGDSCTPDVGKIAACKKLDWTLAIENKEMKGTIFLIR
ncbi:hypothetical protein FACS1894181_14360 [Bacteroidia bacterium]|nr:hypothetical protein FACS1894181_14360 [Bacteroidia bacterium]